MFGKIGWRRALLCCFAFSSLLDAFVTVGVNAKQDRAWKHYRNPNLGYCVSYPGRWSRGDAFEGDGLFVETGAEKSSRPIGEIDIGPLFVPPEDARIRPVNLSEDLKDHLEGLQKFERAERMDVFEKREIQFLGSSALFTKCRYYDPQERANWVEELLFVNHAQTLYRLELECRADQLARFEPVFSYLLTTFQFDCDPARR
jgi:hypothetical protein